MGNDNQKSLTETSGKIVEGVYNGETLCIAAITISKKGEVHSHSSFPDEMIMQVIGCLEALKYQLLRNVSQIEIPPG